MQGHGAGAKDHAGDTGWPGEGGGWARGTAEGWHGGTVGSVGGSGHGGCGRVGCWRGQHWVSVGQRGSITRAWGRGAGHWGQRALPGGTGREMGVSGSRRRVSGWDGTGAGWGAGAVWGRFPRGGGCRGLPPGRGRCRRGRTPRADPGGPGRKGRPRPALPTPPGAARCVRSRVVPGRTGPSRAVPYRGPPAGVRPPGHLSRAHRVRPQHNRERPPAPPPPQPAHGCGSRDPGGGAGAEDRGAAAGVEPRVGPAAGGDAGDGAGQALGDLQPRRKNPVWGPPRPCPSLGGSGCGWKIPALLQCPPFGEVFSKRRSWFLWPERVCAETVAGPSAPHPQGMPLELGWSGRDGCPPDHRGSPKPLGRGRRKAERARELWGEEGEGFSPRCLGWDVVVVVTLTQVGRGGGGGRVPGGGRGRVGRSRHRRLPRQAAFHQSQLKLKQTIKPGRWHCVAGP